METEALRAMLKAKSDAKEVKSAALAKSLDIDPATLSRFINDKGGLNRDNYIKLANWADQQRSESGHAPLPRRAQEEAPPKKSEYTEVPWLDAIASMGGGSVATSKYANAHLAFRTDWIRPRGHGKLSGMVVINAAGDSMFPTIPDRSVVLINEEDKTPVNNGIFFVCCGNGDSAQLFLKRLRVDKSGKATHLISDIDGSEIPLDTAEYFEIIGRALWYGKEL